MRPRLSLVVTLGLWLAGTGALTGCRQTPPGQAEVPPAAPLAPVVDVKRLMSGMVDPSADVVWQSVAITLDRDGEHHKRPSNDEEWLAVQNHAMIVAESANLLMIAPRARDTGEWMTTARQLREAAARAYQAALNRDAEAILRVGGEIYDACVACHEKYLPPGVEDPI
jgi:hypothetical protein